MKLNFLDSGIDSLKKGFENLIAYEEFQYNNNLIRKSKKRYYHLKDAILFIQHGTEILFKQIIYRHSEYLLFSNIDDNVKKALKEKKEKKLKSIFESEFKHRIHTVSFSEAIERIKILPNITLKKKLEYKIRELELYRNIIMHAEAHLDEIKINQTFDGLSDLLDLFFYDSLGKSYRTISGYGDLVQSFKTFEKKVKIHNQTIKENAVSIFMNALIAANFSMGVNELKRFTDLDGCNAFLNELFKSDLRFGTDIYNGFCSGDIKIAKSASILYEMNTHDNSLICEFKLKSIIIYLPELNNDTSPIIFIESDKFTERNLALKKFIEQDHNEILHVDYCLLTDGSIIVGETEKSIFYESSDCADYENRIRFYSAGIICFINIQGLKYNHGLKGLIQDNPFAEGKDLEVAFRDVVEILGQNAI